MGISGRQGGSGVGVGQFPLLGPWLEALRPVRGKLTAPLATIFRDKNRSESERTLATNILTDYASDDPNLIADLLMDADPKAYAAFFPIAQRQAGQDPALVPGGDRQETHVLVE